MLAAQEIAMRMPDCEAGRPRGTGLVVRREAWPIEGVRPAWRVLTAAFLACVSVAAAAVAQEGHPLTGTWSGDWGPSATERTHLTLVMEWDGKNVIGTINPGPDAVSIESVVLDVTSWTVRIDADAKDASGKPARIAAEGRLEDIGSWHRRLAGTWTQGAVRGDFRLTRN